MLDRRELLLFGGAALVLLAGRSLAAAECAATSSATQGPYWRANAPFSDDLRLAGGEAIVVQGVVRSVKSCRPIAGALLDVWQADHKGKYDLDYRGGETFGRARISSGSDGSYRFHTVRPAAYGTTGSMRPAHIHFIVSAPGQRSLVTQLYFEGDPHLDSDPLGAVHPDLVKPVKSKQCTFDIYLG